MWKCRRIGRLSDDSCHSLDVGKLTINYKLIIKKPFHFDLEEGVGNGVVNVGNVGKGVGNGVVMDVKKGDIDVSELVDNFFVFSTSFILNHEHEKKYYQI